MRLLVTGAGGFVGGHLVHALVSGGHEVWGGSVDGAAPSAATPRHVRWVELDVTSDRSVEAAVALARPEGVFHLAGQASVGASFTDPLGTWEVNATGTLRLLEALEGGTRFVLASSAEVYGVVPEAEQPIGEGRPLRPPNPYAASKAAAEMVAVQASLSGRVEAVVARSFNHTGPGQDTRFALPSFARQIAAMRRGEEERVLRVGNLDARRDFLDVRDVVRAYVVLLEHGAAGEVYNVCSGRAHRLRDVVDAMVALTGGEIRVEVDPERVRPVDVPLMRGDAARLRAVGWSPRIPLEDTLRDLLRSEEERLGS